MHDLRHLAQPLFDDPPVTPTSVAELRARARRRRSRRLRTTGVALAIVVLASGILVVEHARSPKRSLIVNGTTTLPAPLALRSVRGSVAVAGGANLRIVSASGVRVVAGETTCCPQWSHDGRWLAFLSGTDRELWITKSDGTARRRLATNVEAFGWSPRYDWLALADRSGLRVDVINGPSAGPPSEIAVRPGGTSFAWSPDGLRLAASSSTGSNYREQLRVYSLPKPEQPCPTSSCLTVGPPLDVGNIGGPHFYIRVVNWRPDGTAVVAWVESTDNNGRLDGAPLLLVSLDGSRPVTLGTTVVQPDWVRWSPDGHHLAIITGFGREVLDTNRRLTVCDAHGACRTLTPASLQARDPEWTPDGRSLLYTAISKTDALRLGQGPPAAYWPNLFAHRELWTVSLSGGNPRRVEHVAAGIGEPTFVGDNEHLVVVHNRAIEEIDLRTGGVVPIADLVENPSTDPYWTSPHSLPDDHPYEGIESGPGGWSNWFATTPPASHP